MIAPSDYTPADVLTRAEWAVADRRQAFLAEYDLALAWADLHSAEPEPEVEVESGERLVRVGGDGTPLVRDLCLAELAVARSEHVYATRALVADLLDLRHRLPHLWAQVQTLRLEGWVARKVAHLSRKLSREGAMVVDAAVAEAVALSPGRLLAVAEAKIVEADTDARRAELDAARQAKGVWPTSSREDDVPGLRSVFGEAPTRDEVRAAAFGWLARPHDLAELLGVLDDTSATMASQEQRKARRPQAVVYVHLHQAALEGATGLARTGLGPLLIEQLATLVGHAHITLTPVIDLNTGASVNGYEHPQSIKARTLLRTVASVFPHASGTTTRVDHDHVVPYDPLGPPGQTGDHNNAPLDRHAHRAKTHLGYRLEQLGLGTYLWTTPHGLHRLVNHTDTHHLTAHDADFLRRLHSA